MNFCTQSSRPLAYGVRMLSEATISCKTHDTIFLMNVALQLNKILFAKFPPTPPINVDHSFRHYGHFVSGQHCAGGRGEVLPRFGMLENSPKTVKCVINFETDCSVTAAITPCFCFPFTSDVIVQIVDARNPLLFRCEDLVLLVEVWLHSHNIVTTFLQCSSGNSPTHTVLLKVNLTVTRDSSG